MLKERDGPPLAGSQQQVELPRLSGVLAEVCGRLALVVVWQRPWLAGEAVLEWPVRRLRYLTAALLLLAEAWGVAL